jgi:hypothetical protein
MQDIDVLSILPFSSSGDTGAYTLLLNDFIDLPVEDGVQQTLDLSFGVSATDGDSDVVMGTVHVSFSGQGTIVTFEHTDAGDSTDF